jgi:hypothetical protein
MCFMAYTCPIRSRPPSAWSFENPSMSKGASSFVLAGGAAPSFANFPRLERRGGRRAGKARQSVCFTHSLLNAWRLSARRPALSRQPGHAFGGFFAGSSALVPDPFRSIGRFGPWTRRRARAVSRLPAGGLSAPGWSPGTARARAAADSAPADTGPSPTSRRNRFAAPRRGGRRIGIRS